MRAIAALATATVAALLLSSAAHALDTPTDRVVLTVTGAIDTTNNGSEAVFDLSMLRALPGRVGEMETPWIEGKTRFGGPLLQAVLDSVGARGKTLRITALNDYSAEIPATDASDFQTILAIEMNGQPMSVRGQGTDLHDLSLRHQSAALQ